MKMKYIILTITIILLYSCGSSSRVRDIYKYSSATFGSVKSYTTKPVYKGEKESTIYATAEIGNGENTQNRNESEDLKTHSSLRIHRSITDKNYNLHYGLGASFGKYEFSNTLNDYIKNTIEKSYYTIDAKTGFNYNISKKTIDYRLFGLEFGYHYEGGEYHKFIDTMPIGEFSENYIRITTNNPKSFFSFNINTEIVFKMKGDKQISFGLFSGKTWITNKSKEDFKTNNIYRFGGLMGAISFKNVTFSLIGEAGHINNTNFHFRNTNFGMTYRIPNRIKKQIMKKN